MTSKLIDTTTCVKIYLLLSIHDDGLNNTEDFFSFIFQDAKKKREEERQKQIRWREEHRNALLQGTDSVDTGDSSNGKINRGPSFGDPGNQTFRQKRWQRDSKGGLFQIGDSVDTQDSNFTKYHDSLSHDDLLEPHGAGVGGRVPRHQSTIDPMDSAQRSPDVRSEPRSPETSTYQARSPTALDPSMDEARGPRDVHLIDFGDGDAGGSDDEAHLMASSPTNILSGSRSSLPVRPRTPTPPSTLIPAEPTASSSGLPGSGLGTPRDVGSPPLSHASSRRSIPPLAKQPSSVDMATQVLGDDIDSDPGLPPSDTPPRRSRHPSRQTTMSDVDAPSTPPTRPPRDRDRDPDDEDPDTSYGSAADLRSTRV